MSASAAERARRGYERAVLHVLADNHHAVRLYESKGWQPLGKPFQHSLLKQATQTYVLDLHSSRARQVCEKSCRAPICVSMADEFDRPSA